MRKILINFAHPVKSKSKINKELIQAVQGLEGITVNDLYENYPDFYIDVEREQKLAMEHDVIIFQYPFYWYSSPSIVKEWQDLVLGHGWAYGSKGKALQGKDFLLAITAGGDETDYTKEGYNNYTIDELTVPLRAMSKLCGMNWLPPFAVTGVHRGLPKEKMTFHGENYRKMLIAMRDENFDKDRAKECHYCNSNLDDVIRRED